MAYGIDLCRGCEYGVPFEKTGTEPAFFNVHNTGLVRGLLQYLGRGTENYVDILDESTVARTTMPVPDVLLDKPGSLKEAIGECKSPVDGMKCGAVPIMLEKCAELEQNGQYDDRF